MELNEVNQKIKKIEIESDKMFNLLFTDCTNGKKVLQSQKAEYEKLLALRDIYASKENLASKLASHVEVAGFTDDELEATSHNLDSEKIGSPIQRIKKKILNSRKYLWTNSFENVVAQARGIVSLKSRARKSSANFLKYSQRIQDVITNEEMDSFTAMIEYTGIKHLIQKDNLLSFSEKEMLLYRVENLINNAWQQSGQILNPTADQQAIGR